MLVLLRRTSFWPPSMVFILTSGEPSVNRIVLLALTLVGPIWPKPAQDPLAVLQLENRLYIPCTQTFKLCMWVCVCVCYVCVCVCVCRKREREKQKQKKRTKRERERKKKEERDVVIWTHVFTWNVMKIIACFAFASFNWHVVVEVIEFEVSRVQYMDSCPHRRSRLICIV